MMKNERKLSDEAPIVVTWIPRNLGASLPDGKNSELNYLDVLVNHKQKNKEDRDIYLVVNGSGFNSGQIEELKSQLKEKKAEGIHIIDLHEYDWSNIDQEWKIDGNSINIKQYYKDMYSMKDEQRTYFAIEIDTFRLIALALLEQFTKQKGGIYIDFDSLRAIDDHIGKGITIPEGMLLGFIGTVLSSDGKIIDTLLNNDLIAISGQNVISNILSKYKGKILNQQEVCNQAKERLCSIVENEQFYETLKQQFYTDFKARVKNIGDDDEKLYAMENIGMREIEITLLKYSGEELSLDKAKECLSLIIEDKKLCEEYCERQKQYRKTGIKDCIKKLEDEGIKALYDPKNFEHFNFRISLDDTTGINLSQDSVTNTVHTRLINEEANKSELFSFTANNGNYVIPQKEDLSWMKENLLYPSRKVSSQLQDTTSTSVLQQQDTSFSFI